MAVQDCKFSPASGLNFFLRFVVFLMGDLLEDGHQFIRRVFRKRFGTCCDFNRQDLLHIKKTPPGSIPGRSSSGTNSYQEF
jgi:hypothetical protein